MYRTLAFAWLTAVSAASGQKPSAPHLSPDSTVALYCAAWRQTDPATRDVIIAKVWSDHGEYSDPRPVSVSGHAGLRAEIQRFQRDNPGATFRCGHPDAHQGYLLYTWVMVGADGVKRFEGTDFGELDADGRLRRIVSFFGSPPRSTR